MNLMSKTHILFSAILAVGTVLTACDDGGTKDPTTSNESSGDPSTSDEKSTDEGGSTATDSGSTATDSMSDSKGDTADDSDSGEKIPDEFKGKENTFELDDEKAIAAGKPLYEANCKICHGAKGDGSDGPGSDIVGELDSLADDKFLWVVSDGLGTKMPDFADDMTQDEMWQVLTYLHSLK